MISCQTLGQLARERTRPARVGYDGPLYNGRLCDMERRIRQSLSYAITVSCLDVGTLICTRCDLGLAVPNSDCKCDCAYQCSEAERATCPCYDAELRAKLLSQEDRT